MFDGSMDPVTARRAAAAPSPIHRWRFASARRGAQLGSSPFRAGGGNVEPRAAGQKLARLIRGEGAAAGDLAKVQGSIGPRSMDDMFQTVAWTGSVRS